uniref:Uncharacterized protein n=1 Tax=Panagrolaimus davidi TaxID=227884 RepID=A0A914QU61_9BILA
MLQAIGAVSQSPIQEEYLRIFEVLFDHVENYGEAVIIYFDSCSDNDFGPFSVNNFSIGQYINQIETYYGNHNDISSEQCIEPSKLFAWALIGNTKECLMHFCTQSVVMQNTMLNFLRLIFENIPFVCQYVADFKKVKGSLLLNTIGEILPRYKNFPQNLDTIQHMLFRMAVPRKTKQISLIPPVILYHEIMERLVKKDMIDFWIGLFADFIRGLKKNNIKLNWSSEREDILNPAFCCVFLIKLLKVQRLKGVDVDEIFRNLGDLFKAQNVEFGTSLNAFRCCTEIDWASKFALMDHLQIPSTSFPREIPSALYSVLYEGANYIELTDADPTFENYLIGIFELAFTVDQIPDELIKDVTTKFPQSMDVTNCIAICFHRAYSNIFSYRDQIQFNEMRIKFIEKLLKIFDCKMDLGNAICTPALFEVLWNLQPCLIIGRAALSGILHYISLNPKKNPVSDFQILDNATLQLLSTFFEFANKFYSPYHDELRAAINDGCSKLSTSKLSIMSAVYVVLKKRCNTICKYLKSRPEQMRIFMNRLEDYLLCYMEYVQKEYNS